MTGNLDKRSGRSAFRRRLGFTMIEIMTSVTLSLMLMYAVARIFSRVGGTMNETTSIMQATNSLRNAKNRLTADLEGITVDPVPPRNSRLGDGYLCYVEGMGAPIDRLYSAGYNNLPQIFSTDSLALDSERFQAYPGESEEWVDTTVGDVDDILSFTARAPVDKPFRGRYVRPKYDAYGNVVSGEVDTFESEFAEIVWFVRGTTLYRRVLPILSNERLQESLKALRYAARQGDLGGWALDDTLSEDQARNLCEYGFGFFRFYDVSVHLDREFSILEPNIDPAKVIKTLIRANTLGDLTNRANRYGYWNPVGVGIVDKQADVAYSSFSVHGASKDPTTNASDFNGARNGAKNAWYWLRMPTLQESVQPSFRAGAPFGDSYYAKAYPSNMVNLVDRTKPDSDKYRGLDQILTHQGSAPLNEVNFLANELPIGSGYPFIDFWNTANVWDEVNRETGDLIDASNDLVFNQDVMLTNVLSFNVKAWDPDVNDYIDLGFNLGSEGDNPSDLCSGGHYLFRRFKGTNQLTVAPMPCVYDTWTEQYQRDLYLYDQANGTTLASGSIADVSLDGKITSAQLKDYPPPYDVPLKSLQIEIRVFDPRSKQIRNVNFVVDLTK